MLLAGHAVVAGMGALFEASGKADSLRAFDLDAERLVGAAWSSAVLVVATMCCRSASRVIWARWESWGLALVLALMAADEYLEIHEWFEVEYGIDWMIVYSPVFLFAGVSAVVALRRWTWPLRSRQMFVAGGAAWFVSQVLEYVQWDGHRQREGYRLMMLTEEALEMVGSSLFLLSFLAITLVELRPWAFIERRPGLHSVPLNRSMPLRPPALAASLPPPLVTAAATNE